MTAPFKYAIEQWRGDTCSVLFRLWRDSGGTPVDLTGAVVTAQVRETAESADPASAEFDVSVTGNEVTLTLTPEQTRALPASGVYDLQVDWLADGTQIQTVAAGKITTSHDVTR